MDVAGSRFVHVKRTIRVRVVFWPFSDSTSAWCRSQLLSEASQIMRTALILLAKFAPRQLPLEAEVRHLPVGQFVAKAEIYAGANVLLGKPPHVPTRAATDHKPQEQPQCRLHIAVPRDSVDLFAGGVRLVCRYPQSRQAGRQATARLQA